MTAGFPVTWPTDRAGESPDLGVGVDTIALAGPTSEAMLNELRYQQIDRTIDHDTGEIIDRRRGAHSRLAVGASTVRVASRQAGSAVTVAFEVSMPTMLCGHNRDPLRVDSLIDATDAALSVLAEQLPDVPRLADLRLRRLDLARDFHGLPAPSATIAALSRRQIPHAKHHALHRRPNGSMQSFSRGSLSQYLVRGYAKGYELADRAAGVRDADRQRLLRAWAGISESQLRYELQLRAPLLKRLGLITMDDCTAERLHDVARHYYEHAGWSAPYGGGSAVLTGKLAALSEELTAATYRNLLAYLHAETHGVPSMLGRHAIERVRPIARKHHLLTAGDSSPLRRLDFASGQEIEST